jgi:outer membrane protein TolC
MVIRRFIFFFIVSGLSLVGISQSRDLNYYLREGLQNSPLINDLKNQLQSASLDSIIIEARRKPQVEGRSQLLYSPYNDHFGYDEVITDGGNYQAVAYVSQDLFVSKKTGNKYQALNYEKQGLNLSVKLSAAELLKTITDLYLESYSVYSELMFNVSFLDLMKNENQVVRRFVENGIYSQADYLSLLVETGGQEVIITQLRNQYRKNIMSLNELCGIVDTSQIMLQMPVIEPHGTARISDYLILRQYSLDSLRIINEKDALSLRYKPSVNWFADAGILTSNPFNFYRHAGASAGVSLTVPIYDGHQKKVEEDKLSLKEDSRSRYFNSTRKEYDQIYLRLNSELEGLKQVKAGLEKQLALSDQLVKSLRVQLENGIIKMQDYIAAIKNYRNINRYIILSDIDILRVKNEINYILAR